MWKPAAIAAALLALSAASAVADSGSALQLSAPATTENGRGADVTATGTNPPGAKRAVTIVALPLTMVSVCPADAAAAEAASRRTADGGGSTAATWQQVYEDRQDEGVFVDSDPSGAYTAHFAWSALYTGRFLLCGYLTEPAVYAGFAYAAASTTITVFSANRTNRPAVLDPPRLTRSGGRLVCHHGRWTPRPTRYGYAWTVDGRRKGGATGRTLRVTKALHGHAVRCAVTAFAVREESQILPFSKTAFTPAIRLRG